MKKINLVVTGTFTYPRGMAGTKRIQNMINALKEYPDLATRVILQRQSALDNMISGVHEGTPYETVMGDLFRSKMLAALPILCYRTIAALRRAFRPDHKNVIYFYGPLFVESVVPLSYAKRLGYKIVFDVIEDYGLTLWAVVPDDPAIGALDAAGRPLAELPPDSAIRGIVRDVAARAGVTN